MGRLLIMVTFLLGGVCPVQLPSSLPVLNSTQRSPDSYLISCNTHVPEERVTQVHWKARHTDGTYSVIAVQNPHWGNSTHLPYHEVVKLNKMDDATYTMEMTMVEKVICCEVVTYPSGKVHESCLTIEEDSDAYQVQHAVLGALLVGGFFILGSFILLFHICWLKKNTRVLNLRGASEQGWTRHQRPSVPYRRAEPSINLAYEPPIHTETPPLISYPRQTSTRNQPSLEDSSPRNLLFHVAPPLRNHWISEDSSPVDPTSHVVPPLRSHMIHDIPSTTSQIYSNVNRLNKPYRKVPRLKNLQHESTMNQQHHPEIFPYVGSNQSSLITPNHTMSSPWLCGETSHSSEELAPLQPSKLHVPRTPESPFSTVNPMYHSGNQFNYKHPILS